VKPSTILLIDDEPDMLRTMVEILEADGHVVVPIGDSRDVPPRLAKSKADLIVSDIVMPHLNGLQLLQLVRAERPDLPVLLVTSFAELGFARKALEAGACGFLEKPFESAQLVDAVRQGLLRRGRR
jgi:two-component system C4-dicarboxylate transport response regulator DctD